MSLILSGSDGVSDIDGSASTPAIRGTDANTGIFFPAADTIAFGEGGAEVARFDSSGNFGVGVTAGAPATGELLVVANKAIRWMNASSGTEYGDIYTDTSNNMVFRNGSGATERARITSDGSIKLGTGTIAGNRLVQIAGTSANGKYGMEFNYDSSADYTAIQFYRNSTVTVSGSVTVQTSSVSYNTSSDYRLKHNIQPMTGALEKVAALKPVIYKWNVDGSDGQGFIAHELQAVVPDCVTGEKDAVDADGNPQYQGVDTSFLVATLTAAIQELNAKVQTLEAQNAAFEARLAALEGV